MYNHDNVNKGGERNMTIYNMKQEDGTMKKFILQGDQLVEVKESEPVRRITVTPEEGRVMIGLGRNSFMDLLHSGEIRAKKCRGRWLIPIAAIEEFLGLRA